eukprot:363680-Chlamydomonas_euryale.AAC.2
MDEAHMARMWVERTWMQPCKCQDNKRCHRNGMALQAVTCKLPLARCHMRAVNRRLSLASPRPPPFLKTTALQSAESLKQLLIRRRSSARRRPSATTAHLLLPKTRTHISAKRLTTAATSLSSRSSLVGPQSTGRGRRPSSCSSRPPALTNAT